VIARSGFHDSDRWKQPEGSDRSQDLVTIARGALNALILSEKRAGENVPEPRARGDLIRIAAIQRTLLPRDRSRSSAARSGL
jgi:hypothetical protein